MADPKFVHQRDVLLFHAEQIRLFGGMLGIWREVPYRHPRTTLRRGVVRQDIVLT